MHFIGLHRLPSVALMAGGAAMVRLPSNSAETMTAYQWRPSPSRVMWSQARPADDVFELVCGHFSF